MKILFERNLNAEVEAFEKDSKYFCGNCAKEISKQDKICPRCESKIIHIWGSPSKSSYLTKITVSENNDKLFINVFEGKTTLVNGKFYFQKYIHPFIFNFKSGQSYKLPILNGETKKPLRKKGNGIRNISYCSIDIHPAVYVAEEEIKELFLSKARQYAHYTDEIEKLKASKGYGIANLMLSLTKFKYCDKATEAVVRSQYTEQSLKPVRKYWLKPGAKESVQKTLRVHYPLDVWKLFKKDFSLFSHAYKIGYLKPDNQRKLVKALTSVWDIYTPRKATCHQVSVCYINSFVDLIRLSDNENEMVKRVTKIILSNPYVYEWVITDSVDMLRKIINEGMDIKRILKMQTFNAIHDETVTVYRKIKQKNRLIHVSSKEKALNSSKGNIEFAVCTETDQLFAIGDTMHICVGSYGDKAVNKDCLIVKGEVNGKLFACIEIRNKCLIQVKGYCNQLLKGEEREAVIKWAKEKGLNYKDCFDLKEQKKRIIEPVVEPVIEAEEPAGDIWLPF